MSPQNRVHAALRDHTVPLSSKTGDSGDHPIQISNCLETAQIVGLGEATHGTRECFQQKVRLIRHLVDEAGFRTVAFEADAAASTALDAFVRDDDTLVDPPTDAASALVELDMWQWQTETVEDLLQWLRKFNAGRTSAEQVRVRGVDLSTPAAPAVPLRNYFERVDPSMTESEAFRTVADASIPADDAAREQVLDAVGAATETLIDRLERDRESYGSTTSETAWAEARHFCRVVEQAAEWARVRHEQPGPHPEGMATRDRFMAENALWALEQDTGTGVALWAHDGHVKRGTFDDGTLWADTTTMGDRLAGELGDAYRPVGLDFARGSFRAVDPESGTIETFEVGDPPEDSATAAFAAVDEAPYMLDLGAAIEDSRLDSWLGEERRTRYVGSVFDPEDGAEAAYARTSLPSSFDYLLFVPESTPTRPLDSA